MYIYIHEGRSTISVRILWPAQRRDGNGRRGRRRPGHVRGLAQDWRRGRVLGKFPSELRELCKNFLRVEKRLSEQQRRCIRSRTAHAAPDVHNIRRDSENHRGRSGTSRQSRCRGRKSGRGWRAVGRPDPEALSRDDDKRHHHHQLSGCLSTVCSWVSLVLDDLHYAGWHKYFVVFVCLRHRSCDQHRQYHHRFHGFVICLAVISTRISRVLLASYHEPLQTTFQRALQI